MVWAEEYLWSESAQQDIRNQQLQVPTPLKVQVQEQQQQQDNEQPSNDFMVDDVVIHFRCGDVMTTDHPGFGFLKFDSYAQFIPETVTSIGIITQPYVKDNENDPNIIYNTTRQTRVMDKGLSFISQRCQYVVNEFVLYLQERFTKSTISVQDNENNNKKPLRIRVWNDENETITIAFARMILANVTIVGSSSFGTLAATATFGTAYIVRDGMNYWIEQPNITELLPNVNLFDSPLLTGKMVKQFWDYNTTTTTINGNNDISNDNGIGGTLVVEWMRNESMSLPEMEQLYNDYVTRTSSLTE
jgi:hypothetical protein